MEKEIRPVLPVVMPTDPDSGRDARLSDVLGSALRGVDSVMLCTAEEAEHYFSAHTAAPGDEYLPVLFVVPLGQDGVNLEYTKFLRVLRRNPHLLEGYVGGVITDGMSDLYTKTAARELVFTANTSGCAFVGRPLVEATKTLSNFTIAAQILSTDERTAYRQCASVLVQEVLAFRRSGPDASVHFLTSPETARKKKESGPAGGSGSVGENTSTRVSADVSAGPDEAASAGAAAGQAEDAGRPNLLVLHASIRKTSNTLALWHKTAALLKDDLNIREISLQNGTLYDCAGCPYHTCLHYGEKGSCFYGGIMVESVYPAVRRANGIVMLCANYNDALSANLTAFINRLTALFRQVRFYDKALFAVIVSGYSGSDILAEQLISALNMNKTFYLPAHFCLMETANNAGQAVKLPGIDARVAAFADRIRETLCSGS